MSLQDKARARAFLKREATPKELPALVEFFDANDHVATRMNERAARRRLAQATARVLRVVPEADALAIFERYSENLIAGLAQRLSIALQMSLAEPDKRAAILALFSTPAAKA